MFNEIIMTISEWKAVYHMFVIMVYRYYYDGTCTLIQKEFAKNPRRFRRNCCKRMQYHYGKYCYILRRLGYLAESIEELNMIYIEEVRAFCRDIFP
nr:MAG TPA: hypothetical protein [Caudoviricetes sp.]